MYEVNKTIRPILECKYLLAKWIERTDHIINRPDCAICMHSDDTGFIYNDGNIDVMCRSCFCNVKMSTPLSFARYTILHHYQLVKLLFHERLVLDLVEYYVYILLRV